MRVSLSPLLSYSAPPLFFFVDAQVSSLLHRVLTDESKILNDKKWADAA